MKVAYAITVFDDDGTVSLSENGEVGNESSWLQASKEVSGKVSREFQRRAFSRRDITVAVTGVGGGGAGGL